MASFIIEGGHLLQGTITPQGAKNEALQVICASLLTEEEVSSVIFLIFAMLTTSSSCCVILV